jgi:hypothetical protein
MLPKSIWEQVEQVRRAVDTASRIKIPEVPGQDILDMQRQLEQYVRSPFVAEMIGTNQSLLRGIRPLVEEIAATMSRADMADLYSKSSMRAAESLGREVEAAQRVGLELGESMVRELDAVQRITAGLAVRGGHQRPHGR